MKQHGCHFVADGPSRYMASPEYQAYRAALRGWLAEIYAPLLAEAGFFRRAYLRWVMRCEFEQLWSALAPSEESYW